MSDNNFDLPQPENTVQENLDRNRKRKSKADSWDLRSPIQRKRSLTSPRLRVSLDSQGNFLGVERVFAARHEGISGENASPEVDRVGMNADHMAGKHNETPDLDTCGACQYNERKRAMNAAAENIQREQESMRKQYLAHTDEVKAQIHGFVEAGVPLQVMLKHFESQLPNKKRKPSKKTASAFKNVEEDTTVAPEKTEQVEMPAPKEEKKTRQDRVAEQLGRELEPWETLFLKDKRSENLLLSGTLTDAEKAKIHSKMVDAPGEFTVPEIKPMEKFKKDLDTGETVPYTPEDYMREHEVGLKKAIRLGNKDAEFYHRTEINKLKTKLENKTLKITPPKKAKKETALSADAAIDDLIRVADTGQHSCSMRCEMSNIRPQCKVHGSALRG